MICVNELCAALEKNLGLSPEAAARRARHLAETTDPRIEENLLQWMRGQPITDVWVGKYCVNAILFLRQDEDFLSALDAMNLYLRDPGPGEALIWRKRR